MWFFGHDINLNCFDDNVLIGRQVHEKSYGRKTRNVCIDGCIALDVLDTGGGGVTVFEVKKSSKLVEPVRMQVYYYLWYLKHNKGVEARGLLKYPREKKEELLELNGEVEGEIEGVIKEIPMVLSLSEPPKAVRKPYCRRCSYFDLCMV